VPKPEGDPRRIPAAACTGVTTTYRLPSGTVEALRQVDLVVPTGQVTVVAGPSGSGKSTLLRTIGLLEVPTAGRVQLAGVDVSRASARVRRRLRRQHVAYVFQRPGDNLVDDLPVVAQLRLAADLRGAAAPDAAAILGRLGLADRGAHRPHALSGGEQQRVAFAAALASGAGLVVADEPTAQLDPVSAEAVVAAMAALTELGATVLVSSHDEVVMAAADQLVRLSSGQVVG
jgi:putative ABC transport system ATP-binding protein